MDPSQRIALTGAGVFFLIGLLSGIWKYLAMLSSENGTAHEYINVLHQASLMYGLAGIVIWKFAALSVHAEIWNITGVLGLNIFFGLAIFTYLVHAVLKDTDNQMRKPFVLGPGLLPAFILYGGMSMLIVGELGGFLILLTGAWPVLWP